MRTEDALVAGVSVRLMLKRRSTGTFTVLAAWAGAKAGAKVASSVFGDVLGDRSGDGAAVGLAYGLGRLSPAWRTPLLASSAVLRLAVEEEDLRTWMAAVAGSMLAVAAVPYVTRGHRPSSPRQVALVINDSSGSARLARRAHRALRCSPVDLVLVSHTDGDGLHDALTAADDELPPGGIIAVAGGDGTVGAAAAFASKAGRTLAILPTGTGNDIARSLHIPLGPEEAAAVVARGEVDSMDLGVSDDGSFVHAATLGTTVDFAERVSGVHGWRRPLVYPGKALQAWRSRRALDVEVIVDGAPMDLPDSVFQIAVVNAPRLGGRIGISVPEGDIDDGLFDVIVPHHGPLREAVGLVFRSMRVRNVPRQGLAQGRLVEIRGEGISVAFDGEPVGCTPLVAKAKTSACKVIRPAS